MSIPFYYSTDYSTKAQRVGHLILPLLRILSFDMAEITSNHLVALTFRGRVEKRNHKLRQNGRVREIMFIRINPRLKTKPTLSAYAAVEKRKPRGVLGVVAHTYNSGIER